MPLDTSMIGAKTEVMSHAVTARWLMAYAAGLADYNPRYLDTEAGAVIGHPVFPVCLEWPVILSSCTLPGYESVTAEESARGVHAAHDLHIFRPVRAGEQLRTHATVIGLRAIKPGAAQTSRLDTIDEQGELLCRTYQLSISRGVAVTGEPRVGEMPPALPDLAGVEGPERRFVIPVAEGAAHVYTECARIWNPIHTDRAVALAAGLPDIILHGTATMALAVSRVVDELLGGDPTRVCRLGGRFTAMVLMPSCVELVIHGQTADTVSFTVLTQDGQEAFSNGFLCFNP